MKKVLSLILVGAMIMSMIGTAFAVSRGSIHVEDVTADPGAEIEVPIVVDKNNIIVAGHTRLKASKKLGLEKVPVIIADDLSDEKVKAFRLADNKVSEFATWDDEALEKELEELELELETDMEEFGFEKDFETLADKVKNNPMNSNLFDTFVVPPFSI